MGTSYIKNGDFIVPIKVNHCHFGSQNGHLYQILVLFYISSSKLMILAVVSDQLSSVALVIKTDANCSVILQHTATIWHPNNMYQYQIFWFYMIQISYSNCYTMQHQKDAHSGQDKTDAWNKKRKRVWKKAIVRHEWLQSRSTKSVCCAKIYIRREASTKVIVG